MGWRRPLRQDGRGAMRGTAAKESEERMLGFIIHSLCDSEGRGEPKKMEGNTSFTSSHILDVLRECFVREL